MVARRYWINADDLHNLVKKQIGKIRVWFADRDCFFSLREWRRIIREDKTDMLTYVRESRDCDDFSLIFKAEMSKRFQINGVGFVVGETFKPETNEKRVHAWNVLVVRNAGRNELWFLEPLNDHIAKAGKKVWLYNKYYHPTYIMF